MARQEIHSDTVKIDQKPPVEGDKELKERGSEIVEADPTVLGAKQHLERLAFDEEPVTIRLEPSTDKNAASVFPIWVNGRGAEVLAADGKTWREVTYLPVGVVLTTKRKYVAVLAAAKIDTITTEIKDQESERPDNRVIRFTSALHSFSIIKDDNPRGAAWLAEIRRRNF